MTKYRFHFDPRGAPLATSQLKAAVAARATAAGALNDAPAAPRSPVEVVNELRAWMEEHPDFGLDMNILEERQVLLAPPPWSYVVDLAASLTAAQASPQTALTDEWQTVEKYVRMLGEREDLLNEALMLAAAASVASTSRDSAERMRSALRALPKGGRMAEEEVKRLLALPPLLGPRLLHRKAREWADDIRNLCGAIVKAAEENEPDWKIEEEQSWEEWHGRFQKHGRRRQNFDVNARDLLLRTRSAGPAALFRNELLQMTVREWTDAFVAASARTLPPPSQTLVPEWVVDVARRELIAERGTLLLIVGASASSPTAQWLPSQKNDCLWVEGSSIERLANGLHPFSSPIAFIALEVVGDVNTISTTVLSPAMERVRLNRTFVYPREFLFLGHEKLPSHITPALPYIESPRDVDDAVAKARTLLRGSSSSGTVA